MERNMPTYLEIVEEIKLDIVSGKLEPNSKLESIKALSIRYNVNQNTMQRALAKLEKEGLLFSRRTAGKFVTDNKMLISAVRMKEAKKVTDKFLYSINNLGVDPEELKSFFAEPDFPLVEYTDR